MIFLEIVLRMYAFLPPAPAGDFIYLDGGFARTCFVIIRRLFVIPRTGVPYAIRIH